MPKTLSELNKEHLKKLPEEVQKKLEKIPHALEGEHYFVHSIDEMDSIISRLNIELKKIDRKYLTNRTWIVFVTGTTSDID